MLQFALFEMDEARRLLGEGHLPAQRVALLLLDNAAEVLLDRWIESDLVFDGVEQRLQETARSWGVPADHPGFAELLSKRFRTQQEKRKLSRYFDEKLDYVTAVKPMLSKDIASTLSHLHRYRNQAYHSGRVRRQTLRTSAIILLELCCQLAFTLRPRMAGVSSKEDYSWLESRFGVRPGALWDDDGLSRVLDDLRKGLPVTDESLGRTLSENLLSRIQDVYASLDFIVGSTYAADRTAALSFAHEHVLEEVKLDPPYGRVPARLGEPVSTTQLEELSQSSQGIVQAHDGVAAFAAFAGPDMDLERIEFVVESLSRAVDEMVQDAIDVALGK